jgi:uncharacterized membrane protein
MMCTARYTVTAADVSIGSVNDTAVASATNPAVSSRPSSASVDVVEVVEAVRLPATASLSAVKSAEPSMVRTAGQAVTYSVVVANTGTVTLTNVAVAGIRFTGTGTLSEFGCPPGAASLPPGGEVTCTATYVVTNEDIEAGLITGAARASARTPDSTTISSVPTETTVTVAVKKDHAEQPQGH